MFVHSFVMTDSIKIHYTIAGIKKKKINKIFFLAISSFYFASTQPDPACEAASWQL